ncbi:MAG: hypothetical protein ABI318_16000, partial [Chthoniobacteraceae bacterium]
ALSRHTATGAELESVKSLRASVAGTGDVKAVRPLAHGPLKLTDKTVVLPDLATIDVLISG